MRSVDDLEVQGRRVIVRVDFNVPLSDSEDDPPDGQARLAVTDDRRIVAALQTIEELRRRGARLVGCQATFAVLAGLRTLGTTAQRLCGSRRTLPGPPLVLVSHLGRPRGHHDPSLSMAPVAERLRELTGAPVTLAPAVVGEQVKALTEQLHEGDMLLLENVRFEAGETANDPALAHQLAELADAYVNDAFGVAHRAHASTEGVAHLLPSAAGRLLEREVKTLTDILEHPTPPLAAIVGGAKVADKIGMIDRFLQVANVVMIGGAMCFPFLCAQGHKVGESLCDEEDTEHARKLLSHTIDTHSPQPGRARLLVPSDLVIGRELSNHSEHHVLPGIEVPAGWMGLDIGPETVERYSREIERAGTVLWNGPMGAFEFAPFASGTREIAGALATTPGLTVVGGGDTAAALAHFGFEHHVDHVSTGGGAALELVRGVVLPSVAALEDTGVAKTAS